jgi:hypothetical protein
MTAKKKTAQQPILCASCGREMMECRDLYKHGPFFFYECRRCAMRTPPASADRHMSERKARGVAAHLARRLYVLVRRGAEVK